MTLYMEEMLVKISIPETENSNAMNIRIALDSSSSPDCQWQRAPDAAFHKAGHLHLAAGVTNPLAARSSLNMASRLLLVIGLYAGPSDACGHIIRGVIICREGMFQCWFLEPKMERVGQCPWRRFSGLALHRARVAMVQWKSSLSSECESPVIAAIDPKKKTSLGKWANRTMSPSQWPKL